MIDMTKALRGFEISKRENPISQLHPLTKLILFVILISAPLISSSLILQIFVLVGEMPLVIAGKMGRRLMDTARGSLLFFVLIVGLNYLFTKDINFSFSMGLRLMNMIVASSVFMASTTPMEIGDLLSMIRVPYYITFSLVIALRFIPVLARDVENIVAAQQSRGIKVGEGGFLEKMRSLIPVMVPTVVLAIRRSQQLGEALETKAFGAVKRRTIYVRYSMSFKDVMLLLYVAALAAMSGLLAYSHTIASTPSLLRFI